jgi:hypothetical protein
MFNLGIAHMIIGYREEALAMMRKVEGESLERESLKVAASIYRRRLERESKTYRHVKVEGELKAQP